MGIRSLMGLGDHPGTSGPFGLVTTLPMSDFLIGALDSAYGWIR